MTKKSLQSSETSTEMLFLSHAWKNDELGRDNHQRVVLFARALEKIGWHVWLDDDQIHGNVDSCVARGIDKSSAVLFFLTRAFFERVDGPAKDASCSNCLNEWTYAINRRKVAIPVIMEPSLRDVLCWPGGIVTMRLSSTVYIDGSLDVSVEGAATAVTIELLRRGIGVRPVIRRSLTWNTRRRARGKRRESVRV